MGVGSHLHMCELLLLLGAQAEDARSSRKFRGKPGAVQVEVEVSQHILDLPIDLVGLFDASRISIGGLANPAGGRDPALVSWNGQLNMSLDAQLVNRQTLGELQKRSTGS